MQSKYARSRGLIINNMWLVVFLFLFFSGLVAKEVSFTLEDRERIIRLEEGQKALIQRVESTEKSLSQRIEGTNKRIEDTNRRIDDMMNIMLWGFGVLFAGMMTLIGFVIWDRRTALSPAIRKTEELEEREKKIERALKKLAEKNPEVKDALKEAGLL